MKLDIFTIKILTQTNQFLNSLKIDRILQRVIKFDFIYDGNYENYFRWILRGFDGYEKSKLGMLKKNAKFLFYRFNDLWNQSGRSIKVIKHSAVTDDYIAAEESQNQNWQYFIKQVLEVCKDREISKTIKKITWFFVRYCWKCYHCQKIIWNIL